MEDLSILFLRYRGCFSRECDGKYEVLQCCVLSAYLRRRRDCVEYIMFLICGEIVFRSCTVGRIFSQLFTGVAVCDLRRFENRVFSRVLEFVCYLCENSKTTRQKLDIQRAAKFVSFQGTFTNSINL